MILKKLVVSNGTYKAADGTEKKRWVTIGQLHEHEGRSYITLDAHINLAGFIRKEGESRVFVSMFDPEEQGQRQQRPAQPRTPPPQRTPFVDDDMNDSIPF